jgi:hypothetical protein
MFKFVTMRFLQQWKEKQKNSNSQFRYVADTVHCCKDIHTTKDQEFSFSVCR